jgi:N-acetylglutamate synthase
MSEQQKTLQRYVSDMLSVEMIRGLEEQSLNTWPALHTMHFDGWVLRFADGYTRRANSVNPLYPSTLDLAEQVAACEQIYDARGQDTVFKLTSAALPPELDAYLARQGYLRAAPTHVCSLELQGVDFPPAAGFESARSATDAWLETFCALNGVERGHLPAMTGILHNLVFSACFGALRVNAAIAAVGLAVMQRASVWLFDIVTAPEYRRQGRGRELVLHLLSWARTQGARHAYLQVMQNNAPALGLYRQLGFRALYDYWYRVKAHREPEEVSDESRYAFPFI